MALQRLQVYDIFAPAKINLCLDIVGQRADGYHLLDGVMQRISLGDRLECVWEEDEARSCLHFTDASGGSATPGRADADELFSISAEALGGLPFSFRLLTAAEAGVQLGDPLRNTLVKTLFCWARALAAEERAALGAALRHCGLKNARLSVRLEKNIPSEAGLGGASADAAALLRFLAACFPELLPPARQLTLAAEVGADVPFCLAGVTARCRGIGEELLDLEPLPALPLLIVKPKFKGSSTVQAFRRYHEMDEARRRLLGRPDVACFVTALEDKDYAALAETGGNVFADLIREDFPDLALVLARLREQGAFLSGLSGSGTASFGLFYQLPEAELAAAFWAKDRDYSSYLVHCMIE